MKNGEMADGMDLFEVKLDTEEVDDEYADLREFLEFARLVEEQEKSEKDKKDKADRAGNDWRLMDREKRLESSIFELGKVGLTESIGIIRRSVDKYAGQFTDDQIVLLREFLTTSYYIERENNRITDPDVSIGIGRFIENLSGYAMSILDLLEKIHSNYWEPECEDFLVALRGNASLGLVFREFICSEFDTIMRISPSDLFEYDRYSRSIILSVLTGLDNTLISSAVKRLDDHIKRNEMRDDLFATMAETSTYNPQPEGDIQRRVLKDFLEDYKPARIIAYLDKWIVKQNDAKEMAALFLRNHIARLLYPDVVDRSVICFFGPSGCGKTEIWRRLKAISPVPIEIIDASAITSRGFQGADLTEYLTSSTRANKKLKKGIVVLDEFDKLIKPSHSSAGDDVSAAIQSAFLSLLEEGRTLDTNGKVLNLESIDYVCCGAFVGIDKCKASSIGFNKTDALGAGFVDSEQFIGYGMMPELAGRITSFVALDGLKVEDFYRILTLNDNPLRRLSNQYERIDGITLRVEDDAKWAAAKLAFANGLGARGLLAILRRVSDRKYIQAIEAGESEIVITKEDILGVNKISA